MTVPVCILRTDGTNCDAETAYAFATHAAAKAGGRPRLVHINELRASPKKLGDYPLLVIPGGFADGDHVAAGKVLAVELVTFLRDELEDFVSRGKLVMGICNGFQVLCRTGLLPFGRIGEMSLTLAPNDSGRFECRWVDLLVEGGHPIYTRGLEGWEISLMVAHGEGKFFADGSTLKRVEEEGLVALRYASGGKRSKGYPANPNGSLNSIAGICDPTGRVFGLMPHLERSVEIFQHPNWRRNTSIQPRGLPILRNAVSFAAEL